MKNSGRMLGSDGKVQDGVCGDSRIVELSQLIRAKTFSCEFEECDRLVHELGEYVSSKVCKTLHGNTYQKPFNR